jgi:antitoxin YefM
VERTLEGRSVGLNMARVVAMEYMTLASVKDRLSEVVSRVDLQHERVMITRHGQPTAVIMSAYDLECLEETLEVLSDPAIMAELRASRAETQPAVRLTRDEARAQFRHRQL